MVVARLFSAGDQVPVMPFKEVVGRGSRVDPEQTGATGLKAGVLLVPEVEMVIAELPLQPLASFTVIV